MRVELEPGFEAQRNERAQTDSHGRSSQGGQSEAHRENWKKSVAGGATATGCALPDRGVDQTACSARRRSFGAFLW